MGPSVAAGTVTHQNIGYLFPQGPFYWLSAQADVPVWVAQRLWMGSLLFAAGAGVRYLARTLGVDGPGALVAGLAYELSPYFLQYIQQTSAILLPWSGLGWLVAFAALAVRRSGWRYPALFAFVVALVGATNATSLIYAGIAPVAWLFYGVFVLHEAPARRAFSAGLKMGLLSLGVSLFWIAGLRIEGAYGINVLRYTETLPAIAGTSLASEVVRGLGYWYFYGSDRLGPWKQASVKLEESAWLLVTSFAVPALGVIGATLSRWRAKAFFALLTLVGVVLAVGLHPFAGPSIVGRALKAFMSGSSAGLALRSSDRATPLVVLGFSMLLGAGIGALLSRLPRLGLVATAGLAAVVVANTGPFLGGDAVAQNFQRPEKIPPYYAQAARYLDAQGDATRVLIEPGENFAAYDWGTSFDAIWPGIMTRPEVLREQTIQGSYPTTDLLQAFDLTLQQGTYEPSTLAPIARLFSAGDVVLQSNLAFWRYDTPRPQATWALFNPPPPGIGKPVTFGAVVPNIAPPQFRLLDEEALALPADAPWPAPIAVFPVHDPRPIYRAEPASTPLVIDGSGPGVVAAAGAGLLADNPTIFYAGTLVENPKLLREVVSPGAQLVLTDTNRNALERWSSVSANIGETLPAVPEPSTPDPTAVPLPIFVHARPDGQSIAVYSGARYVTASTYGNPVTFTPENRPAMAFDGDTETAWSVAAFSAAAGNWLQIRLDRPVTTNQLNLVQVLGNSVNRWITRVTLQFNGGHLFEANLTAASRVAGGQTILFPRRSFTTLRITIAGTTWSGRELMTGASGVGFSEVRIPGVTVAETIQMPSDLLRALGTASLSHRLTLVMTRDRVSATPPRSDPELAMRRDFWLPTARSFSLGGTARMSALIPDNMIDSLLAGPDVFGGAVIGSNERLPGDLNARAVFAFDGNPKTFWSPGFDGPAQIGAWMQVSLLHPITFDHLNLQVIADGRHSVPTRIRITTDAGGSDLVSLPPIRDRKAIDSVVSVPVSFPSLTGSTIRFTIEAIRTVATINWYSEKPITMPVGIAEVGLPGVRFTPESQSARLPSVCSSDLLRIDGQPVWLKVSGTVGATEELQGLTISGCGPDTNGIALGAGTHTLVAIPGKITGWNLDRLVLDSAPGGAALPPLADGQAIPTPGTIGTQGMPALANPTVRVLASTATFAKLDVNGATGPFWLVLGESVNAGWEATGPRGRSLGPSQLIDGYANGWYVTPTRGGTFTVSLRWKPQSIVTPAVLASGGTLCVCVVLGFVPIGTVRRRLRRRGAHSADERAEGPPDGRVAHRGAISGPAATPVDATRPAATPVFGSPFAGAGVAPMLLGCVLVAAICGAVALAVLPPPWASPIAAVTAVATLCALRWSAARSLLSLSAIGCFAAAGAVTVFDQIRHHYPPGASWPHNFETAGVLAFVGVVALATDAIVEVVRHRRAATDARDDAARPS
ncbi:MAG TPA: alpha-(1-_3)-arabinofuranosyltransferase family protein [Acidimicrobiales bacterium]|nr:alpha-(1->3)-arabinofuranosyltransferase family protein [Acidimicrobiales bacterium]